jgi:hypothetical protein
MVITPRHDYYPLTLEAQEQVPRFMRSWITPREPPQDHVVSIQYHAFCSMLFSTVVKISFVITLNGHAYFQVLTTGALHQIDYASLRKAASAWHDEFAALPKPLVVVNIGWPRSMFCLLC